MLCLVSRINANGGVSVFIVIGCEVRSISPLYVFILACIVLGVIGGPITVSGRVMVSCGQSVIGMFLLLIECSENVFVFGRIPKISYICGFL